MVNAPLIQPGVASPCINICRLDTQRLCVGCRRTIDEIAEWAAASDARRRDILRAITLRPPTA